MPAGKRRHRVELQRSTRTQNTLGEGVDTWATFCSRWGEVVPLTGRELEVGQQLSADVTTKIALLYDTTLADLSPLNRIKWGTRIYDIDSVINTDERNRELVLMCHEERNTDA